MRTVVQAATPYEIEALRRAFGGPALERIGKRRWFERDGVVVVSGGVGKAYAAAACEFAIGRWSPSLYVDFGAAGALTGDFRAGDLVLATGVVEHDVQAAVGRPKGLRVSTRWREGVEALRPGVIAAGDRDVDGVSERRALHEQTGAVATCWESGAIARICGLHGVEFVAVRVITDCGEAALLEEYKRGATLHLPPAAERLVELLKHRERA